MPRQLEFDEEARAGLLRGLNICALVLIHEKKISVWPPGWSTSCAITENLGIKLENIELDDLGRAKKIVVGKDNTTIVEGVGKSSAIEGRIEQIRAQLDETTSAARRPLGRLGAYKRRSARTGLVSMKAWPPC